MVRITGPVMLACALALACGDAPTAVAEQEALTPTFDALGASGCYKVEIYEYDVVDAGGPEQIPSVLSGDLVGTGTFWNWSGGQRGRAFLDTYNMIWEITGSPKIPELIGETLNLFVKAHTQYAPGQYPQFQTGGQTEVFLNDVKLGNLEYNGIFDVSAPVLAIDVTHKGVLCL